MCSLRSRLSLRREWKPRTKPQTLAIVQSVGSLAERLVTFHFRVQGSRACVFVFCLRRGVLFMHATDVTRTWPMRLVGVWCFFGNWKGTYRSILEATRDPEIDVICVYTEGTGRVLDEYPTLPDEWGHRASLRIDGTWPTAAVAAAVLEYRTPGRPFLAAVCFTEDEVSLANQLNRALGAETVPAFAIRPIIDKVAFYTILQQAGVPVAQFHVLTDSQDIEALVSSGVYRQGSYILKPAAGAYSAGVYRSRPDEDVRATLRNFHALRQQSGRLGHSEFQEQPVIVMDYVEWQCRPIELAADGVVKHGEVVAHVVSEKLRVPHFAPFFDQRMVALPSSPDVRDRVREVGETTQRIMTALGFSNGVFHLEYRLSADACIPIDCGLRPGGGFIPHAVFQLTGVDLILAHVAAHFAPDSLPATATHLDGGTCIGALFGNSGLTPKRVSAMVRMLTSQKDVFGVHATDTHITSPVFTDDAVISFGVVAATPGDALSRFESLACTTTGTASPGK